MTATMRVAGGLLVVAFVAADAGMAMAAQQRHLLTGTYQLQTNRGDDPMRAAEQAARSVPQARRQRTVESLLARLEAPEMIEIERSGNTITMASTRGPRVSVEADGRNHAERWSTERTMNTRTTLRGERLTVETTGYRGDAFTVTFEPTENGRGLRMTRTIDDTDLRRPVTVRSFYRRVSDTARWDTEVNIRRDAYDDPRRPVSGSYVPDGTRLVAVLDAAMSTTRAREGDVYTMTAVSPREYEGAIIDGTVARVNSYGQANGGVAMTLDLQRIRFRDGTSHPFAGVIEHVRTPDGGTVRVDREGAVDRDTNRTQRTVERGVIGAALGAIVGAVVGGGKGAAIGAVIGAGGGAGTVLIEGRDRLDLPRGTELTITSGDPRYRQ